ncbi:MAG: hypothetical protein QXR06_01065 [Candidatus Bathyarchaeia archaeon]
MSLRINKMIFATILVAAFIIGAFSSYLWVAGFYASLELNLPEKPVISVHSFLTSAGNSSFFNITILNPSLSPEEIKILGIYVLTEDGISHKITSTKPSIPVSGYAIKVGESKVFTCFWNWINYTGQRISIAVLAENGSGGTLSAILPLLEARVTDFLLDPERGSMFNITVMNSEGSVAKIKLTGLSVIADSSVYSVATQPQLPLELEPNGSISLTCLWNWTEYQGKTITIAVITEQKYVAEITEFIPQYVVFNIEEIKFSLDDPSHFNLTVLNSEYSVIPLNITKIRIRLENGTLVSPLSVDPSIPHMLDRNSTITFMCGWDWSAYRDKELRVTVYTEQGYKTEATYKTPA